VPRAGALSLALLAFAVQIAMAQPPAAGEAGGNADVSFQGYYLGGDSQPLTALSGLSISFRQYFPALGLITGNLEGYDDSSRGRVGQNFVTLHGLKWKDRRWTITGGDFLVHTAAVAPPFSNYTYPEIGARGVKIEMSDGRRDYVFFVGNETLQEGPRITFRAQVPQFVAGASVQQRFGKRLIAGVRYLRLSSSPGQVDSNQLFFPIGSQFTRSESVSAEASYTAARGLTFWSDATLSHVSFAPDAVDPHSAPFSWLTGAKWQTKRLTFVASYGSLTRSALPIIGYFFGDRKGPSAEVRYKIFRTLDLFGSAVRSSNNLENNPSILSLTTRAFTAGAETTLPHDLGLSAQISKISLNGDLPSDPTENQRQRNIQSQLQISKSLHRQSLLVTGRDLELESFGYQQKQRSVEAQDTVQLSRFVLGGAVRYQQQNGSGQLDNSVFFRASMQMRIRAFSFYGQFEKGNDLVNKTLFSTNSVNTEVIGVRVPVTRNWTLDAEAFRTTLLTALNPVNILVLQTEGTGVADVLNDFNQWSFYVRLHHPVKWGAPVPTNDLLGNDVIYGAVEGFVYDGTTPVPDVPVQIDQTRFTTTDSAGHYRFDDIPDGSHAIGLNLTELPADLSPGPAAGPIVVKPRSITRADLHVVKAGSSIHGAITGIVPEDKDNVHLDAVIVNLSTPGRDDVYTTCSSSGEFAFYNLPAGTYSVFVDRASLPADYTVVSDAVPVELGASDPPPVVFRIQKHVSKLPLRKVFESVVN
jgi:hypothetical protein